VVAGGGGDLYGRNAKAMRAGRLHQRLVQNMMIDEEENEEEEKMTDEEDEEDEEERFKNHDDRKQKSSTAKAAKHIIITESWPSSQSMTETKNLSAFYTVLGGVSLKSKRAQRVGCCAKA
jgi:hypothetical protein